LHGRGGTSAEAGAAPSWLRANRVRTWLRALDFALGQPKEIAIMGPSTALRSAHDGVQELLNVMFGEYRPNQVVAFARDRANAEIPLLAGRTTLDGRATAYVCRNFGCQMPVIEPEPLEAQLKG
jgi:uncharacterized protein